MNTVANFKNNQTSKAIADFYQFLQKVDAITRNCVNSFTKAKSPGLFKVDDVTGNEYYGEGLVLNILYTMGY